MTTRRVLATAGNPDCGRLGHELIKEAVEFPLVVKHLLGLQPAQVSAGGAHTAVVTSDGSVYTFGLNDHYQLGHSTDKEQVNVPLEVPIPEPAIAVAAGNFHTLCLTTSGNIWAWGRNKKGELGLGSDIESTGTPRLVASLKNEKISAIAAGAEHSLALSTTGEVYSWGCSDDGRLGHAARSTLSTSKWVSFGRKNEYKPRLLRSLETQKIAKISAGHMHSGCLSEDGHAFVFGSGRFHQLGRKSDHDALTPIELQIPRRTVRDIACGATHSLAITEGGVVASWGAEQNGCLGRSNVGNSTRGDSSSSGGGGDIRIPEPVPGISGAEQIAAGWKHSAAIVSGGKLLTWGWGGSQGTAFSVENGDGGGGQLGLGSDFDYWRPTTVTHLATGPGGGGGVPQFGAGGHQLWRALQVSCGMNHTAMIFEVEESDVPL
jgi:alpha-tubulin suppressor-like RCC1 family protein